MSAYSEINPNSQEWWRRSLQVLAGGGQAHRRTGKYTRRGGPAFAVRAKGAYFWDVDGRRYLDYLLSYGPIILGHCDPEVNEAVRRQMEEGTLFSLEHPAVVEFDEELCRTIPCAEMVINLIGGHRPPWRRCAVPAFTPNARKLSAAAITAGLTGVSRRTRAALALRAN